MTQTMTRTEQPLQGVGSTRLLLQLAHGAHLQVHMEGGEKTLQGEASAIRKQKGKDSEPRWHGMSATVSDACGFRRGSAGPAAGTLMGTPFHDCPTLRASGSVPCSWFSASPDTSLGICWEAPRTGEEQDAILASSIMSPALWFSLLSLCVGGCQELLQSWPKILYTPSHELWIHLWRYDLMRGMRQGPWVLTGRQ